MGQCQESKQSNREGAKARRQTRRSEKKIGNARQPPGVAGNFILFFFASFFASSRLRGCMGLCLILMAGVLQGCKKGAPPSTTAPSVRTVASLVPAATDLIIGMGAKDHLVAVSTYDRQRPDVDDLPKVGDYQTFDWEMLRSIRPAVIVVQMAKDRLPAGFNELHAEAVNVSINRLDDVPKAIDILGDAMGTPELARAAKAKMQARLNAVRARVAGKKPVRTLLVVSASGDALVGPGTYLDDLLKLAGGVNAAAALQTPWPQVDREMLRSLKPDVIIQLLPKASAQEKARAAATWAQLPEIPAVAAGRVYVIDNWYALLPGWHVTDLAERFAECLYPSIPSSSPSTLHTGQ
jgi:ABC-type Fe3+-hydroxamate transport system substrate-binding protein